MSADCVRHITSPSQRPSRRRPAQCVWGGVVSQRCLGFFVFNLTACACMSWLQFCFYWFSLCVFLYYFFGSFFPHFVLFWFVWFYFILFYFSIIIFSRPVCNLMRARKGVDLGGCEVGRIWEVFREKEPEMRIYYI